MATKKITDLTQLTDLDATDSFVVNDSGAGADKRVEFSDLQSEVLNGAAIGTSTAITELQVDNLNLNGNTFSSTDTNGNILIQPNGTGDTIINESGADSDFRVEGDTDTDLLFVDASADRVGISTNAPGSTLDVAGTLAVSGDANFDSGTLFVDVSTNRVGIGTTSPENALHVAGSQQLEITSPTGTSILFINNAANQFSSDKNYHLIDFSTSSTSSETTGGYVRLKAGQEVSGNDNSTYLAFWTAPNGGNVTERLRIDSSGNVGIGTSSPSAKLDVRGSAIFNEDGADADFRVEGDTDTHLIFADAGNDRVGIGTSSPAKLLDVDGEIRAKDGILFGTDTAAANALDDYEEGTFTPTIVGTTIVGTGTYTSQVGVYTKIGDIVNFSIYILYTAHTGTGNMNIVGLPFATTSNPQYHPVSLVGESLTKPTDSTVVGMAAGTGVNLYTFSTSSATSSISSLALDTSATFFITGSYKVS